MLINPLVPNLPFLYPLKTSESRTVFCCFHAVEKGCIGNEWVKESVCTYPRVIWNISKCNRKNLQRKLRLARVDDENFWKFRRLSLFCDTEPKMNISKVFIWHPGRRVSPGLLTCVAKYETFCKIKKTTRSIFFSGHTAIPQKKKKKIWRSFLRYCNGEASDLEQNWA